MGRYIATSLHVQQLQQLNSATAVFTYSRSASALEFRLLST
jgi:hypothetical protein